VERAVLRASFLILIFDAIILLLLYNVMLAGDARFAVLRLTFFLFLFIIYSNRSGTLGSRVRGHGRSDQPPRLAHDGQILTRRDYENAHS
jgi:hypothetical protein